LHHDKLVISILSGRVMHQRPASNRTAGWAGSSGADA